MFVNKDKKLGENFSKSFCDGYNTGIALVKKFPENQRENVKQVLHSILQERSKDITFHGIFAGFCYQQEQEHYKNRLEQIKKLKEQDKAQNNDLER